MREKNLVIEDYGPANEKKAKAVLDKLLLTEELDFEPVSLKEVLPESILEGKRRTALRMRESGTMPAVPLTEAQEAACIQLLPGILEADGFFMARFRRKS